MKFGHKVSKQVSYKFVIDKFYRKLYLQAAIEQKLSANQECSRKGINSKK